MNNLVHLISGICIIIWISHYLKYRKLQKQSYIRTVIGNRGESRISHLLKVYNHIDNLAFFTGKRTVQIDHVVDTRQGVYVIETKNWKGVLSGKANDRYLYINGQKRLNPILQLKWQIDALSRKTGLNIKGVVVSRDPITLRTKKFSGKTCDIIL